MLARAVVIPSSPLLVPGAAGAAEVLRDARALVLAALARLLDDAGPSDPVTVLAPGPRTRSGLFRPSLGPAGVADRWVPALATWDAHRAAGADAGPPETASLPASVALCCLAVARSSARDGAEASVGDVMVHEVAPGQEVPDVVAAQVAGAARLVVAAPGGTDEVNSADRAGWASGGRGSAEVLGLLAQVAAARGWSAREDREVVEAGPHLDTAYQVTTLGLPAGA